MDSLSSAPPDHWRHQADELLYNWNKPGRALLWGMRTGKTRTVVENAELLRERRGIRGGLIMAPNGVHSNWVRRELPRWTERYRACSWSSGLSRDGDREFERDMARLLDPKDTRFKWLAINDEALINERLQKAINGFRKACDDKVLMVADECSLFRRPGARRTMLARGLAKKFPYKRILDGTALFNSPLHAFSQFELLEKGALGFTRYEDFKDRYAIFEQVQRSFSRKTYPSLQAYVNMEELRERIGRWSSVVMREDVDDMPELLPVVRDLALSPKQASAYMQMVNESLAEIGDQQIDAVHGGAKVLKLQQIIGGYLMKEDGSVVSVDDNPPILDALSREVSDLDGKSIVWCRFREDIRRASARLREMGRTVVEYHGGVTQRNRERAIDLFMNDPGVHDLVGQPQAGGRGLNLSAAKAVIWYSATPDAIIKAQADERATMVGGRSISIVRFAVPGTVEEDINNSNERKVALADAVSGRGLRDLLLRTRV